MGRAAPLVRAADLGRPDGRCSASSASRFGGDYNDNFELPGHGVDDGAGAAGRHLRRRRGHRCRPRGAGRLEARRPARSPTPAPEATMTALLTELSTVAGRRRACSPRSGTRWAPACPEQPAGQGGGRSGRHRRRQPRSSRRGRLARRAAAGAARPRRRAPWPTSGQSGVSPDEHGRVRDRDVRGRVVRRPRHRRRRCRARPDQGAERRGRPAGRGQRRVRVRRRRAAVLGGHRRHRRAGDPAVRVRLDPGRVPAHRLGAAVGRADDRVRAAARGALLRRGHVRPDPRVDDRPRGRHRLLAVRHQQVPRGAHPRPGAAGRRPGVRADLRAAPCSSPPRR